LNTKLTDVYPHPVTTYTGQDKVLLPSQVHDNFALIASAINSLNHEMAGMRKLYDWLEATHPEVIEKYIKSNAVVDRMEHK
jgi:hypothetical protein